MVFVSAELPASAMPSSTFIDPGDLAIEVKQDQKNFDASFAMPGKRAQSRRS
jgi:hypothetical protein